MSAAAPPGRLRAASALAAGLLLAAALRPAAAGAHGLVQRENLPIPEWLFGWAAAAVLVISFAALAALWPRPRLEDSDAWRPLPGGLGRALGSRAVEVAGGGARGGAAGGRHRRRLRGPRELPGQPRPDLRLHHVLGRARVRERAARRPLPRPEPVARARPRGRRGGDPRPRRPRARPPALSRAARLLAGGRGPADLHLDRAVLGLGRPARADRHRGAALHRRHARRAGGLRRRGVDAAGRGVRGLLHALRAHLPVGHARPRRRAAPAAGRAPAPRARPGHRRRRDGDDRHGHLRRAQPGAAVERPGPAAQRRLLDPGDPRGDEPGARRDGRAAARRGARLGLLHAGDRGRALGRRRPRLPSGCGGRSCTRWCRSHWSTSPRTT